MKKRGYIGNQRLYRKRFAKRVGSVAIAATFVLGAPVATTSLSDSGLKSLLGPSVVHAATDNIVDFNDEKLQTTGEYTVGIMSYQMGVHVEFPNYEDYEDIRVTWKIPDEMAVDLDDDKVAERIETYSSVSGSYLDEDGEMVSSNEVDQKPYISVNADNQTVEYRLSKLLDDNNLTLDDSIGTPSNLLSLEAAANTGNVAQGTYPVVVSVTDGSADPTDVTGAYTIDFEVDEGPEAEPDVDKGALEDALDKANSYSADDYTEESFKALEVAIEEAEEVVGNDDATQDEVDEAEENVNEAIDALVKVDEEPDVDKSKLQAKVEEINDENLSEEDYTEESWKSLQEALEEAERVLADEDATADDVEASLLALADARDNLKEDESPKPEPEVDKSELVSLLDEIDNEDLSAKNYTEESWNSLQEAMTEAEKVVDDEKATADDVEASLSALTDARDNLEEAESSESDKSGLESLLDEIDNEGLSEEDYTNSSWETLQNALLAANQVIGAEDATQEEVNDSLDVLTEAYEALEEIVEKDPEPEESEKGSEVDDSDQDNSEVVMSDSDDGKTLPETATSNFNWMIGGLIVILAGGAGLIASRRKRVKSNTK